MKLFRLRIIRTLLFVVALTMGAFEARGQGAKLQLDKLQRLADKAAETVDVSLDNQTLQVASKFLKSEKPDEAAIKQLIAGLKGVYVKVFEFDRAGEYASADVEAIRVQLRTPGWSRIVGVHSKRDGDNVEVFTWLEGGNIAGLAILCADPTELVVVNIVGAIDLEKLSQLEGKFGIPKLNLEKGRQHE